MRFAINTTLAVIGVAATVTVALAQASAATPGLAAQNCDQNQQTMNACAQQRYAKADESLNRIYRRNMKQQSDTAAQQALREAQRAWIVYRDKDCAVEAGPRETSGSIWPLQYYGCMERHTVRRTEDLRQQACGMEGCR